MSRSALFLLIAALAAPRLAHAAPPRFEIEHLAIEGEVQRVEAEDLDGDGKRDLVVAIVRGQGPAAVRELAIFWNLGGVFAPRPDLVLPIEGDLCAYDLGDLDGKAGHELLALTPHGVRARSFAGRAAGPWRELVQQPTFFPRAPKEALPRVRLVQPLGDKGAPVLLVPGVTTLAVYARTGEAFAKTSEIDVEVDAEIDTHGRWARESTDPGLRGLGVTTHFPSVETVDLNADGRLDLAIVHGEELRAYFQVADGTFARKPSLVHTFQVRTPKEELEGKEKDVSFRFADVDGDGRADVIVTKQVSEGITSATTTVYYFRGTAEGFKDKPEQTLTTDGVSFAAVQLADFTGDGRPDLVIPSVKIGLFAIIRMLTSKKLKMNFQLHPFGADKLFSKAATAERELVLDLDFSGHSTDPQVIDTDGDYDGDGHRDLAFGTDTEQLSLYSGGKDALFSDTPMVQLPVRAYGSSLQVDLDGQKRSDLVLWYPGTPGHKHELTVAHNRGP